MKFKVTQKEMKQSNDVVIGVGLCHLQNALQSIKPIACNIVATGWNCDLYKINERYSIVTGYNYSGACTMYADFDLVREFETQAIKIENEINASSNYNFEELQKSLYENLIKFCDAVCESNKAKQN